MELDALLGAILAPVAIAALVVVALRLLRARYPWCGTARVPAAGLALVVVLAAAHQSMGLTSWPSIALEWLPWAVISCAIVACAFGDGVPRPKGRMNGRTAASIAAALSTAVGLAFLSPPGVGVGTRIVWIACSALTAAIAAPALQAAGPSAAIGMWGSAAALSFIALQASIAKLAIVLGAFSAGSAALAVLAVLQRPLVLGAPGAALWGVVVAGAAILGLGYDESSLPQSAWWVAMASPAACGLALLPPVARRARRAAVVRACAPIAVAAAAVIVVLVGAPRGGHTHPQGDAPDPFDSYGAARMPEGAAPADARLSLR